MQHVAVGPGNAHFVSIHPVVVRRRWDTYETVLFAADIPAAGAAAAAGAAVYMQYDD